MYADREEVQGKRSIRDRLNGTSGTDSSRRRQVTGKRQRQDDKWEHDLYESDEPQLSKLKVGVRDLRLKLQRKGLQPASQGAKAPASGMRDLREKLSGIVTSQPSNSDKIKPKPATEAPRPTKKSIMTEASPPAAKPAANATLRKKADVDNFLQSLGLEKYSITFQAEEVDMTALLHMTDEDLKALGIPMGPRKKILLALESKD